MRALQLATTAVFCLFSTQLFCQSPTIYIADDLGQPIANVAISTHQDQGKTTLVPAKNDGPLDGVNVYDLVLISKHILGIEPLGAPYKMIAADADKTNCITSSDIAEFRKLILGKIQSFPHNTSWRFVDKDYIFPNPLNPFSPGFPESKTVTVTSTNSGRANFVAIKIGDVNNTHVSSSNCRPAAVEKERTEFPLSIAAPQAKAGEFITVDLRNAGNMPLGALQAGFHFDANALELTGIAAGEVAGLNADCFGLQGKNEGEIRMLWLSPDFDEHLLMPGQILCKFTFKVKSQRRENEPVLALDPAVLADEIYGADNNLYRLVLSNGAPSQRQLVASPLLKAECYPNPTSGAANIIVSAQMPQKARIFLFSAFGARVGYHEVSLVKGRNEVSLPELADLPAGVYSWTILLGAERAAEGHIVKQ